MESSLPLPRRRQSSHMRENHALGSDRPFLVKRHREGSREQAHIASDDDEIPTSRGEKHRRKKKQAPSTFNVPSSSGSRPGISTETIVDRAQRLAKQKHGPLRPSNDVPSSSVRPLPRGRIQVSHDGKVSLAKAPNAVAASEDEVGSQPSYSGAIATLEFNRTKRDLEVETLKKQVASQSKALEKQANVILSLKTELRSMHQTHKDQLSRVEGLETKVKQADELTSNIEGSLQCQICIDTLTKPFALSPCGHVLCQGCLQDWFRNAPVPQDEMNIDEPLPLILRKKTCPFCRAVIRSRPLPLFVLKNILSILAKGKSRGAATASGTSPPPDLEDPWAEIFPSQRSDSDSDAEDDEDEDYSEDDYWAPFDVTYDDAEDVEGLQQYDDTSDDEYEGVWVPPTWGPPAQRAATPLDPEPHTDALLRRGATYGMIEAYDMQYTHQEGITALFDELCLFLGWNIELAEEDEDGERFIAWCLEDMEMRSYRWTFEDHGHIHRLVRRDALEEYDSTDSENWIGIEDEDEEEDIGDV